MSNNMAVPQGVDPRMLAYLAQRQLQHGQQQQQESNYQLQHQQHQHQHHQKQQQQQGQQQQGQRPGGDASAVASCLLQLKTNQYGEPVSEAEALQIQQQQQQQQQHQAALRKLPQMPEQYHAGVVPGSGGYPHSVVPHHGVHSIPGMSGIYHGYPSMVPFPPAPNGNFAVAAAAAAAMQQVGQGGYVPHQMHHPVGQQQHPQQHVAHHPQGSGNVVGLAPMPGGIPGMNHTPQQLGAAGAQLGSAGPPDGPIMSDAYIESLIADDDTTNSSTTITTTTTTNKNKNKMNDAAKIETNGGTSTNETTPPADGSIISAKDDMNISLVVAKDRDLIPDALFVALGQMKPCLLQQSDRVGCYKTRALGFLGMNCKHCGGQPGFGRYFPNSVRSLAQTTTSQTILKHIGGKCRACPPNVRKAVLELQRQQAHKEHLTNGRPRYGSRKIFFQRMWARLHGVSEDGETAVVVEADVTPEIAKEEAAAAAMATVCSSSISLVVPTTTTSTKTVPPTGDVTSGANRSLPTEVSNNNTDEEDAGNPPTTPSIGIESKCDTTSVLNIKLSLNKKRKVSDITMNTSTSSSNGEDNNKVSCSEDEEDERKKLRISPVEV